MKNLPRTTDGAYEVTEHWSLGSDHTTKSLSECLPLMKEIAEGVYHVGFAELALDECHDVWKVRFS